MLLGKQAGGWVGHSGGSAAETRQDEDRRDQGRVRAETPDLRDNAPFGLSYPGSLSHTMY